MDSYVIFKGKIFHSLAQRFADALSQKAITREQAGDIATFVLENIDNAKDSVQLLDFLESLSQKWPIFTPVLATEQGEMTNEKDQQAAIKAGQLLQENKIDEALTVAGNASLQNNMSTGGTN